MSPATIICVASTNASTTTEQWVSANSKHRIQTAMLKPLKLGAKHTLLPLVSHRYFGTAAKAQLAPYVYVIFPEPDFPKRFRRRGTAAKTTGGHRLDVFSLWVVVAVVVVVVSSCCCSKFRAYKLKSVIMRTLWLKIIHRESIGKPWHF